MNQNTNQTEVHKTHFTLRFFMPNSDGFHIDMSGTPENENFISDMMGMFCTLFSQEEHDLDQPKQFIFNVAQQMTVNLRERLIVIFEKYAKFNPHFHKAISKFKSIKDNEYFLVLPNFVDESLKNKMYLIYYLKALNSCSSEEEISNYLNTQFESFNSLFELELEKYDIQSFGETSKRTYIGTKPTISEGACRFCKLTVKDGAKFSQEAHTISEAFGNKKIFTSDECDVCNGNFGDDIEPHLIKYLDIHRTYYQLKGKNGVPTLKFKNGQVSVEKIKEGDQEVRRLVIASSDVFESENGMDVTLGSFTQVNRQKIFKSLCKYTLSVLDVEDLKNFEKTIKWIRSEPEVGEDDPQLSIAMIYMQEYSSHPHFTVYKRKDDTETSLPHVVVELTIGTLLILFILPFSSKDTTHFHIEQDFEKLHGVFIKYKLAKDQFSFEDLSCSEDKDYIFKIRMHKRNA